MVNRINELKRLEKIYSSVSNNFVFIYGNTNSGITELLRDFMQSTESFYYRVRKCSSKQQLEYLSKEIAVFFDTRNSDDYDECFRKVRSKNNSKLVVVIEDVDELFKHDLSFVESLLKLYSHKLYPGKVMIIVTSSSMVCAKKNIIPFLQSRYDSIDMLALNNLSFLDVVRGFSNYNVSECVSTYGIVGGVFSYLNCWDSKKSIKDNICRLIINPEGILFNKVQEYLASELRELSSYNTILSAIAAGYEKLNDLYDYTGFDRAKIAVYLKKLSELGVVEKVNSFETGGWSNAKKGIYRIVDPLTNFYFTFIFPHYSEVFLYTAENFYEKYVDNILNTYLQRCFVNVCKEYLLLLNSIDKLPVKLNRIGTWIGKEGTIDIVGASASGKSVVGVCNWENPIMTVDVFEDLVKSMKLAKINADVVYLFSAHKFDEKLISISKEKSFIILIDMNEL